MLVQRSQIFAVGINSSLLLLFRVVVLEINYKNLNFQTPVVNLTILMAVCYIFNSEKSYFFSFKWSTHNNSKILRNQTTVRVFPRIKLAKDSVFLYNLSKFLGTMLLCFETQIHISLPLKMINGFSCKITASPFNSECINIIFADKCMYACTSAMNSLKYSNHHKNNNEIGPSYFTHLFPFCFYSLQFILHI